MISCRDQNNQQTFEWASYNHSVLVHWFSIQLPNGTVCVAKYTAAGNVYVWLSIAGKCVWSHTCVPAWKCKSLCERVVITDVYRTDVCLQYLQEDKACVYAGVCVSVYGCVCFFWVVTDLSGAWGDVGHKGEMWTGDVLTGRTSVISQWKGYNSCWVTERFYRNNGCGNNLLTWRAAA